MTPQRPARIHTTGKVIADYVQPSATVIVVIFAFFLLLKSMLPATKTPSITLPGGFYTDVKGLALFGWAAIVVGARTLCMFSYRPTKTALGVILLPLLALAAYELLTIPFNGRDAEERFYSVWECARLAAPVLITVLLVSGLPYAHRIRVGVGVVAVLTFIVLIYMGLSFVFPSFRPSSAYTNRVTAALGFIRVFGPLGNAASLAIILYPALGFAVGMLFVPYRSKIFWSTIALILLASIVGTGSRGAVLCIPGFALLLLLLRMTKAIRFVLPIGLLFLLAALLIGVPERFRKFDDQSRTATYATAWRAFSSSPTSVIFGVGHGHLFRPVFANTMRRVLNEDRWYLLTQQTEYGTVLHGAHSTPMKALSETGLVGLGLLGIPLAYIALTAFGRRARSARDPRTTQALFTLAGCITSMGLMLLNTFFFDQPWLAVVWLTITLVGLETAREAPAALIRARA